MIDCVAIISTISGRTILKQMLPKRCAYDQPTIDKAIQMSDDLMKAHGLYVAPNYLLDVWSDLYRGDDNEKQGTKG